MFINFFYKIQFSGFITVRKDRVFSRGGGIVFFVRKNIPFFEIKNLKCPDQPVEIFGLQLTDPTEPINLIACYKPPSTILNQNECDIIFDNINTNTKNILVGDFNAHNQAWNCRNNNTDGARLYNTYIKSDIILHNSNTLTHIDRRFNSRSNIDLIFSTPDFAHNIEFKTYEEPLGSDHIPLIINVNFEKNLYYKKTFKLQSKKTSWSDFSATLNNRYIEFLSEHYNSLPAYEKYNFFIKIVSDAITSATPIKKKISSRK